MSHPIFVTGAPGNVGSEVAHQLLADGHNVAGLLLLSMPLSYTVYIESAHPDTFLIPKP